MNEVIHTDKAPAAVGPYSQAIRCGNMLFASGQIPLDPATGLLVEGSITDMTCRCMNNISAVLDAAGYTLADVVKTTIFLTDIACFAEVNEAYASFFTQNPPARSCVQVAKLPKGAQIEIEVIAAK